MVPNLFYEASITLILKPDKDIKAIKKKKPYSPYAYKCENPQQISIRTNAAAY